MPQDTPTDQATRTTMHTTATPTEPAALPAASLLQLMEWERKNATLTIRGRDGLGLVYVKAGQLIHAAFKDTEGLDAAYRILSWERPQIEFVDTCKVHRTIDLPLAEVLLNTAFLKDTAPGGP